MKLLAQRVLNSSLKVNQEEVASIGRGILALVGFEKNDTSSDCRRIVKKLLSYRMFPDKTGKMERSVLDINGDILLVPQVTLALETRKGARPSFSEAANADLGKKLFDVLSQEISKHQGKLKLGIFGADMQISLVNDGPVTFYFQSK
ncbi:MAG TPA: D-tyrosyl-tRNA(Tyr) deacylase [Gammaproteobacteria bacterium]|nr:D-tyrosyl-tRNA(Tyr) deacylase [Gammaproteobacteria bacterium]